MSVSLDVFQCYILKKLENLLKRALRFLYNNYQLTYEELLDETNRSTMNVKRLRFLCAEIYKTINNLNPSFMKQIFEWKETSRNVREKYRLNLNIPNYNQVTFGQKSLKIFGPRNWNSLPYALNLQKILKLSKLLSKTGAVLIANVWFVKTYNPYFICFHLSFIPYSNIYTLNVCVVGFN